MRPFGPARQGAHAFHPTLVKLRAVATHGLPTHAQRLGQGGIWSQLEAGEHTRGQAHALVIVEPAGVDGIGTTERDYMLVVDEDGKAGTDDASARRKNRE